MIHMLDEQLVEEARRYRLVFACTDCIWFEGEASRCALGYPTDPHVDPKLEGRRQLSFCKTFEIA